MADYQVSFLYDSKKIIPAPTISWKLGFTRSPDGTKRNSLFNIQITGKLIAYKGSPNGSGVFWTSSGYPPDEDPSNATPDKRLARLRDKQGALRALFSVDGKWLEIIPGDGSAAIRIQPRINDINCEAGLWFNDVPYTISAEADSIFFGTTEVSANDLTQNDNSPEESWSIEQNDEVGRIFKLTHNLSAFARKKFDADGNLEADGWEIARDLIIGGPLAGEGAVSKLGFDQSFLTAAGVLDLSTFRPYNYVRGQQTDKANGRCAISETWTCIDPSAESPTGQTAGKATEELSSETRFDLNDGGYTVNLNGIITGLEERDNTTREVLSTRYDNAITRYNTLSNSVKFNLAESLGGQTLNPQPISTTISKNRVTGVLQWSNVYNNRLGNSSPSYLSEIIEVEIIRPSDVFAEIGVINRTSGPILQGIGSKTKKAITIVFSIRVATAYGSSEPSIPSVNPLTVFNSYAGSYSQVFVVSDTDKWTPKQGSYTRSTTYIYQ